MLESEFIRHLECENPPPCPLFQHTLTHMRRGLNNEVSCLSNTVGPPFMPHPFTSSSKFISFGASLLLQSLHRNTLKHLTSTHRFGNVGQTTKLRREASIENNYRRVFVAPWSLQYKQFLLVGMVHFWPTSCPVCPRW